MGDKLIADKQAANRNLSENGHMRQKEFTKEDTDKVPIYQGMKQSRKTGWKQDMNIIENINRKLLFDMNEIHAGGENDIEKIIRVSPFPLPKDYLEFLQQISGEDSYGPEFKVKDDGASIWIWSAKMALEKLEEFNLPFTQEFINNAWLFGNDLGDLVYFFGEGKDGFGIYRTYDSDLSFDYAEKISDTLTDFLVNGIGIDIAVKL